MVVLLALQATFVLTQHLTSADLNELEDTVIMERKAEVEAEPLEDIDEFFMEAKEEDGRLGCTDYTRCIRCRRCPIDCRRCRCGDCSEICNGCP